MRFILTETSDAPIRIAVSIQAMKKDWQQIVKKKQKKNKGKKAIWQLKWVYNFPFFNF